MKIIAIDIQNALDIVEFLLKKKNYE